MRSMCMQEMAMYEQYIIAMLTNFEAGLSVERIHNNLKFFVQDSSYDKTIAELTSFLTSLCNEEKISIADDVYQLRT